MRFLRLAVLMLLFTCGAANSQSLSYQDADTQGEALGMMNTTLVANRVMLEQCSSRFPQHKEEMVRNLRVWEEREQSNILKSRFFWAQASKRDPKFAKMDAYIESVVMNNMDNLSKAPFEQAPEVLSDYCRKHFSELASGIWRTRTPKAYRFLDQAPQPPK